MAEDVLTLEDLPVAERKALSPSNPLMVDYAHRAGAAAGLPANLLPAIIVAGENSGPKSGPNKDGVSPKGARGPAQLMPATAKELGVADPEDPVPAITGAAKYLAQASTKLKTADPALLAASYNAGANHPAIAKGQIPRIPETQAYTKRVTDYMGAQPQAAAPTPALTAELGWEDLPEDGRAAMRKSGAAPDPSTGGSTLQFGPWDTGIKTSQGVDRALTGMGKQFVDAVRGTGQLAVDAVINPLSRAATGKDLVQGLDQAEAERARLDAPVMDTGAGMAGYGLGAAATTFVPGGVLARGAGPALRAVPLVGRAAAPVLDAAGALKGPLGAAVQAAGPQAVAGAGLGLTQPVTAPGERTTNALVSGAIGGGLGAAGSALAASPVGSAARALYDKVAGAAGGVLFKPSFAGGAAPMERAAMERAVAEDVPVYGSQLRDPHSPIQPDRQAGQLDKFTRAVARTMGQDTDDWAAAFPAAQQDLSATYQDLFKRNPIIPLGGMHLQDLRDISAFNNARSPRWAADPTLQDAVDRAYAAAQQNHAISGEEYQAILSDYKKDIGSLLNKDAVTSSERRAAEGLNMIMDSLTKQAKRVMTPEDFKVLQDTNTKWRNMSFLSALAPKDLNAGVAPKQLAAKLAQLREGEQVFSKGDQTLPELSDYMNTYSNINAKQPKGIIARTKSLIGAAAPYALASGSEAALLGSQLAPEHTQPEEGLLTQAAPYGLGIGALWAAHRMGSRALNPALSRMDLHSPRGALGEWFSRTQPGPAVGLTVDAARDRQ